MSDSLETDWNDSKDEEDRSQYDYEGEAEGFHIHDDYFEKKEGSDKSDAGDNEFLHTDLHRSPSKHSTTTLTTKPSTLTNSVQRGLKKTFGLPLDRQSFVTFIHEESTVDEEGYPLLPNGNTVYVKQVDQQRPTNWGTFAFSYTTSGGGKQKNNWQTVRFKCLGVIVCNNIQCDYLGSPPTCRNKRSQWSSQYVIA